MRPNWWIWLWDEVSRYPESYNLSCYLTSCTHTRVAHRYNEHTQKATAPSNTSHVSHTRVKTLTLHTPHTSTSYTIKCMCTLSYLYTVMCEMNLTKIDPRQGGCLGLCTLVYETVLMVIFEHTLEAQCTIEFDDQRYKRRKIRVLDATPARMHITRSQRKAMQGKVISTTGLTLTECRQSVYCESVSCCRAAAAERD